MSPVLRIGSVYAALFVVFGVNLPFLPVWLKAIGLSNERLALVLAAQSAVRVLSTPIITYLADRTGARRELVIGLSAISMLAMLALAYTVKFWWLALLLVLSGAVLSPILPMLDAAAFEQAESGQFQYGHIRIVGSLAFVVGSLAAGLLLLVIEPAQLIWPLFASNALLVGASLLMAGSTEHVHATSRSSFTVAAAARVLISRSFVLFLIAAGLTQASHAMLNSFASVHWSNLGYSGTTIGVLWGLGIFAEITLFHWGRAAIGRVGPEWLLAIGAGLAAVRWFAMGLNPPLALVGLLQGLHAASFGATHIGSIYFIHRRFSNGLGSTAQGLYSAVAGGVLMTGLLTLCGPLYEHFGAAAYGAMGSIASLGLLFALALLTIEKSEHAPSPTPAATDDLEDKSYGVETTDAIRVTEANDNPRERVGVS